jgi:hypothetical protein
MHYPLLALPQFFCGACILLITMRNRWYVLVVREERVSISAFVDPDDHERLVDRARSEERSVSAELRLAIRRHLSTPPADERRAFKARESAADTQEET